MAQSATFASAAPSMIQPTVQERVLLFIRQLLVTGELAPGTKVRVEDIADHCGVSPVPVREALKQLQNEGVVVNEPRRGYWVAKLGYDDFLELQHIATLLETEAIRLAVPHLTDDDAERMTRFRLEMEDALDVGDLWRANIAHREMHFVPFRGPATRRLIQQIARLWEHTDHYRVLLLHKPGEVQRVSLAQHVDLIEACRTRDAQAVVVLNNDHRDYATSTIVPGLLDDVARVAPAAMSIIRIDQTLRERKSLCASERGSPRTPTPVSTTPEPGRAPTPSPRKPMSTTSTCG